MKEEHAISKKGFDENDVEAARDYVQATLGFVLFAGHLHEYIESGGSHGKETEATHNTKLRPLLRADLLATCESNCIINGEKSND